jgi:hypothetical protein
VPVWPRRRRDPLSGIVLVVAVVLRGAGQALTRLGGGVGSVEVSRDPRSALTWYPECTNVSLGKKDCKSGIGFASYLIVCELGAQVHHRYLHAVAPRCHGDRGSPPSACLRWEEHMSFVTTQPEMLTPVPSMSNARCLLGAHTTTPATALAWTAIGRLSDGVMGGSAIHRWTS